jgi:hypothetical protein
LKTTIALIYAVTYVTNRNAVDQLVVAAAAGARVFNITLAATSTVLSVYKSKFTHIHTLVNVVRDTTIIVRYDQKTDRDTNNDPRCIGQFRSWFSTRL